MIGKTIKVDTGFAENPLHWLAEHTAADGLNFLLLHCDDGITWGQRVGATFRCSHELFPHDLDAPTIKANTVLQARVFGPLGELFLWRTASGFQARRIVDEDTEYESLPDETYWLWGTGLLAKESFTLLKEGQQGFRHAPPVKNVTAKQRVGLVVRHYIEEDTSGWARIATSRLVDLTIAEGDV